MRERPPNQRELGILTDLDKAGKSRAGFIRDDYNQLPKTLLDSYEAKIKLLPYADELSQRSALRHQLLAGWMYAEAAIVMEDYPPEIRQEIFECAHDCWDASLEQTYNRDERRLPYCELDTPSPETLKIELNNSVLMMAKAMIEGDISEATRDASYHNMLEVAARACDTYEKLTKNRENSAYGSPLLGFLHEVNAMLIINRLRSTSLIALPALPRSDNGDGEGYALAHDIQVLNTRWGKVRNVQAIEVKTSPKTEYYERYTAALVAASVHINPGSRDPVYITELLVREYYDQITDDERALLDDATDRVVHVIRHGYNGTDQCHNVEDCTLYGLNRNNHTAAST